MSFQIDGSVIRTADGQEIGRFVGGRATLEMTVTGDVADVLKYLREVSAAYEAIHPPAARLAVDLDEHGDTEWPELQRLDERTVKAGGQRIRVHKSDADPWPSDLHGHVLDRPRTKVDAYDGGIYDTGTRKRVGTMGKKDLRKLQDELRQDDWARTTGPGRSSTRSDPPMRPAATAGKRQPRSGSITAPSRAASSTRSRSYASLLVAPARLRAITSPLPVYPAASRARRAGFRLRDKRPRQTSASPSTDGSLDDALDVPVAVRVEDAGSDEFVEGDSRPLLEARPPVAVREGVAIGHARLRGLQGELERAGLGVECGRAWRAVAGVHGAGPDLARAQAARHPGRDGHLGDRLGLWR